jgi:hypothetical protein
LRATQQDQMLCVRDRLLQSLQPRSCLQYRFIGSPPCTNLAALW